MKTLLSIPVVIDGEQLKRTLSTLIDIDGVEILIIDNSTTDSTVKAALDLFYGKIKIIKNKENFYVNKSWGQSMLHFLAHPEYDRLIIQNSDLKMQKQWYEVCKNRWAINPDEVLVPTIGYPVEVDTSVQQARQVYGGIAGVFLTMNREQCELVYPFNPKLKIWFADDIFYRTMAKHNYTISVVPNLLAQHEESSSVSKVAGVSEIIEQDKEAWKVIEKELFG